MVEDNYVFVKNIEYIGRIRNFVMPLHDGDIFHISDCIERRVAKKSAIMLLSALNFKIFQKAIYRISHSVRSRQGVSDDRAIGINIRRFMFVDGNLRSRTQRKIREAVFIAMII